MSMAIAHFAVGASFGVIFLLVTGWYNNQLNSVVLFGFGFWAMIPDLAHPISHSGFSRIMITIHDSVFANLFFMHRIMDIYDIQDTPKFAGMCLVIMVSLLIPMWVQIHRYN